jgi:Protein of unknown function (DUF4079)
MATADLTTLIHPAIAVSVVFPLIGMVVYYALQTRQRRLKLKDKEKSKIPPSVGTEHLKLGKVLSGSVVGVALIGLGHPVFSKFIANNTWASESGRAWFVTVMFALTVASLVFLYRAQQRLWRAIFAILTGMGIILIGSQPEVFRRGFEWQVSHYYYGVSVAMLMIFALATFPEIYSDRSNRWRNLHIALNSIALLFFVGQAVTGARDLLEVPLNWQKPYIEQLYIQNCQSQPCTVQPQPPAEQQPPS